jgi:hypothetical protein
MHVSLRVNLIPHTDITRGIKVLCLNKRILHKSCREIMIPIYFNQRHPVVSILTIKRTVYYIKKHNNII